MNKPNIPEKGAEGGLPTVNNDHAQRKGCQRKHTPPRTPLLDHSEETHHVSYVLVLVRPRGLGSENPSTSTVQ